MILDFLEKDNYTFDQDIEIPKEYITSSDVVDIKKLHINGSISIEDDRLKGDLEIDGTIILKDSVSLEDVEYPISIKFDDFLEESSKKDENKLDLFEFLWENIVLEIPIRFTKVSDLKEFSGEGWKVISEDDYSSNNPLSNLSEILNKKEWYDVKIRYSAFCSTIS